MSETSEEPRRQSYGLRIGPNPEEPPYARHTDTNHLSSFPPSNTINNPAITPAPPTTPPPTLSFHPLTSVTTPSLSVSPSPHDRRRRPSEDPRAISNQLLALADNMVSARQTYFKRFDSLHIYNILQYQYEIVAMEERLRGISVGEGLTDCGGKVDGEGKGKSHLELARELRGLLAEYNAAIQDAQSILTTATVPSSYSRRILAQHDTAIPDLPIPRNHTPYDHHERLLTLNLGLSTGLLDIMDAVSSTLGDYPYIHDKAFQKHWLIRAWNRCVRYMWDAMITTGWAGRFAFGVVGGAFLVVPMVIMLDSASSRQAQIGTVAGSIAVFVAVMAVVTRGTMQDIFGATAAYAAVLVVFVGVQKSS